MGFASSCSWMHSFWSSIGKDGLDFRPAEHCAVVHLNYTGPLSPSRSPPLAPVAHPVSPAHRLSEDHDRESEEAADRGEEHVFVGVPRVALGAEKGHAEFTAPDLRDGPLEELVEEGGGHIEGEDEEVAPEGALGNDGKIENFAKGQGEEESVEKVDEAIEVVATGEGTGIESDRGEPLAIGYFGIGVVRPKGVEAEKEKDENVGKAGENKATGGDDEKEESGGDEDVLEPPVDRMFRRNREGNPPKGVNATEEKKEAAMRGLERRLHGGFGVVDRGRQNDA